MSEIHPLRRSSSAMVCITGENKAILFGGLDLDRTFNDIWSFDFTSETWEQISFGEETPWYKSIEMFIISSLVIICSVVLLQVYRKKRKKAHEFVN
ncbi:MAG: Kelch repeat-containing protein [Candidatus Kariarchaeaceae archaeon]